jgi:ATP phosphoribosyltransferase
MKFINIALSKGRLAEMSVRLFEKIGIRCEGFLEDTRKLIFTDEKAGVRFYMVKPGDVPAYVDYGAADMGVTGRDSIMEEGRNLYEVLNLGFAECRMVLAGLPSRKEQARHHDSMSIIRVATKYPRIAREYFEQKRQENVEIIKLNGSIELAPLTGLSDLIMDLVESGRTLKENGLVIFDTVADISARLVVNRVSMKMENERISRIIDGLAAQTGRQDNTVC